MPVRIVALRLCAALLALVALGAVHGAFCQVAPGGSHSGAHAVALPAPDVGAWSAHAHDGAPPSHAGPGAPAVDPGTMAPSSAGPAGAFAELAAICVVVLLAAAVLRRSPGLLRRIRPGPVVAGLVRGVVHGVRHGPLLPAPSLPALCVLRV